MTHALRFREIAKLAFVEAENGDVASLEPLKQNFVRGIAAS